MIDELKEKIAKLEQGLIGPKSQRFKGESDAQLSLQLLAELLGKQAEADDTARQLAEELLARAESDGQKVFQSDLSGPELRQVHISTKRRSTPEPSWSRRGNGLVLAFSESFESAPEDIYLSPRAARASAFGAALPAVGVNTPDAEGTAFLTSDALALYFFSDRSGGPGERDIYRAARSDGSADFADVRLVEGINSNTDDHTPWLSPDERSVYFASNRAADSDGNNLWYAQRSSPLDGFEPPREVAGMNSDNRDISPSLSADQRTLVFCSDREGGAGSDDIWMATRSDVASDFGAPEPVPVVNGAASELNVALSDDGRELIFSSSRSGERRLYRSVRSCL